MQCWTWPALCSSTGTVQYCTLVPSGLMQSSVELLVTAIATCNNIVQYIFVLQFSTLLHIIVLCSAVQWSAVYPWSPGASPRWGAWWVCRPRLAAWGWRSPPCREHAVSEEQSNFNRIHKIPHTGDTNSLDVCGWNTNKKKSTTKRFMCLLLPTPTATATDPPPANSPTMHSRLVYQDRTQKHIFFFSKLKNLVEHF